MTFEHDSTVTLTLTDAWEQASNVRRNLDATISVTPHDLKDAIIMTASELVENAIKHGVHGGGVRRATFSIRVDRATVMIEVANTAAAPKATKLVGRIEKIAAAEDKCALYTERMAELIARPRARGGLGLYRIAFEGQFELEAEFAQGVVTVRATRRLR